jgi:LPXTG-motif cell wall-anchored protein
VGQAPSATTGTTGAGQLPRTGLDLVPLAALGLALVGAGLVLMRRAARDRR